jgi:uncharacterized protein
VVILLDIAADLIDQYEKIIEILASHRIFPEGFDIPDDTRKTIFLKKFIIAVNKVDGPKQEEDYLTFLELTGLTLPGVHLSILNGKNLDSFLKSVYGLSGVIRVYSKNPGKDPDLDEPFVIPKNSTLEDLAGRIHKDFLHKLKYARIWGTSVHDGMTVQRDHIMQDGDIVEIHI